MAIIWSHQCTVASLIVYYALMIDPACPLELAKGIICIQSGQHLCSILSCFKAITRPNFIITRQLLLILSNLRNLKLQLLLFNILESRSYGLWNSLALGLLSNNFLCEVRRQLPVGKVWELACLCELVWSLFADSAMMHWGGVFGETYCV